MSRSAQRSCRGGNEISTRGQFKSVSKRARAAAGSRSFLNDAGDLQVMDQAGGVLATVGVIAELCSLARRYFQPNRRLVTDNRPAPCPGRDVHAPRCSRAPPHPPPRGELLSSVTVSALNNVSTTREGSTRCPTRALAEPNRYVIVNYLRRTLGQERGGHISPLAAYDADADRFLILDVSRYKYPPVWVKTGGFVRRDEHARFR